LDSNIASAKLCEDFGEVGLSREMCAKSIYVIIGGIVFLAFRSLLNEVKLIQILVGLLRISAPADNRLVNVLLRARGRIL
jgi:DMSO reductase anchor subunit